jgi:signal transduction histidine kinase
MLLLLVVASYGVGAVLGLFMALATPFVLALPGLEAAAVLRVATAQGLVAGIVLLAITFRGVRRMTPLYRVLLRGPRIIPHDPPPSPAAVHAAFTWPERGVWLNTACAQLVPLLDALGIAPISGLDGWSRLAVDLLSVAVAAAGLHPSIILWRRIVWRWLGRLHPADVPLERTQKLEDRLALTATLPVTVVGLAAVVVLSAHLMSLRERVVPLVQIGTVSVELDLTAAVLAGCIIVSITSMAWLVARGLGQTLASDLIALTGQIERVRTGSASRFEQHAITRSGRALSASLSELSERFSAMREKERQGRLAMEEVQRMRTQFLASMSHDLRSPLNSILGFAHLIENGSEGPITREQRESLQMITQSARDLLRLVTNILDSARLEAGRLELRRTWTPSVEILTQAVSEGRKLIGDRPLSIEGELQPGLPPVYVDADRVVQAVVGLFSHAIDAMDRGTIRLVARVGVPQGQTRAHLLIDVVDSGAGIRDSDKESLFEAFREIQEPSGRRIGGLGLGLSLARELARAHGGDAWFATQSGKGTTFSVALPLEGEAPAQRPQRARGL